MNIWGHSAFCDIDGCRSKRKEKLVYIGLGTVVIIIVIIAVVMILRRR